MDNIEHKEPPSRRFGRVDHHTTSQRTTLNLKRKKKSEQNHMLSERKNKQGVTRLSIE